MTREKAIEYLIKADSTVYKDSKTETAKALEMAVEMLKQEPCEDCISRQAAIDAAMKDVSDIRTHDFNAGATRAANRIENLPSVQPARRKGKWILSGGKCRCSGCGEKAKYIFDKSKGGCNEYEPFKSDFCPNCGTDMREEQA